MNIFKKLFHKKNEQERFIKELISHYENIYNNIVDSCEKETITYYSACGMFRHLPLRYDATNIYPEEINQIIDKCFKTLYNYCVKKNIIASNITYEEFYEGKGLYDKEYPISQRYRKC